MIAFQSIIFCSESELPSTADFFPLDLFVKDVISEKFYLGCTVFPPHEHQPKNKLKMSLTPPEDNWAFLDKQTLANIQQKNNLTNSTHLLFELFKRTKVKFWKSDFGKDKYYLSMCYNGREKSIACISYEEIFSLQTKEKQEYVIDICFYLTHKHITYYREMHSWKDGMDGEIVLATANLNIQNLAETQFVFSYCRDGLLDLKEKSKYDHNYNLSFQGDFAEKTHNDEAKEGYAIFANQNDILKYIFGVSCLT